MSKQKKSFLSSTNEEDKNQEKEDAQNNQNNMTSQTPPSSSKQTSSNNPSSSQLNELQEEGQLSIDVYQTEDDIVIQSLVSGVKPDDLDINIQNDMVTIRGQRQPGEKIDQEDYYYQECFWGKFSRAIILPVDIDSENAVAEIEDGVLTIRLPKTEKIKSRKIQVVSK